MKLEYDLWAARGTSLQDCHFIARRWDPRDEENACESFVMQVRQGRIESVIGTLGYYKDLWRSPTGAVFVGGGRTVHWSHNPVQGGGPWNDQGGITSYGVWGLNDELVLAYGDPMGQKMFRFDGTRWFEMAAPGWVLDVHGTSPELIFAVGQHGIARLDGDQWKIMPTDTARQFTSIYVVSEDEMYAILDREQVWEGSVHGWSPMTEMRGYPALTCVAKWKDMIWVGDSYSGLSVLENNALTVVKENLRPRHLDAGRTLLVTHENGVSRTEDGEKFAGFKLDNVVKVLGKRKPAWL